MQMIRSGDNCKTQRLSQIDRFFFSVQEVKCSTTSLGKADNQQIATRHGWGCKGCNTMMICLCRTQPFLKWITIPFISMVLPKLSFFSWFVYAKANHCHTFTTWKFEDTNCKHGRPYWIWIPSFVLATKNLRRCHGSWQAAEIQITQAHAGGVHSEQHRRDDTWLFV